MTQGERIKLVRKQLGLTLEKFGKQLGVGKTAISKLENNERSLTDQMSKSISREYSVSEEWLRTGEGEMFLPISRSESIAKFAEELMKDEEESFRRQLVELLSQLDESEWKVLEKMAKKLAGISEPPQPRFHSEAPSEEELLRSGMVLDDTDKAIS